MAPTGDEPGAASVEIVVSLRDYARRMRRKNGRMGMGWDSTSNLLHREAFSPDAVYHVGPRTGLRFLEGAPIFAVEVRSENDYGPAAEREMASQACRLLRLRHPGGVGCGLIEP